jgi:hypothetical protein
MLFSRTLLSSLIAFLVHVNVCFGDSHNVLDVKELSGPNVVDVGFRSSNEDVVFKFRIKNSSGM